MRKSRPHYADLPPEILRKQCDIVWQMYKEETRDTLKNSLLELYNELGQRYLELDKYQSANTRKK